MAEQKNKQKSHVRRLAVFSQRAGLVASFLLVAMLSVKAQEKQTILVSVVDSASKEPIAATVRVASMNQHYKTNDKGVASLSLKAGRYVMIISSAGYTVKTQTLLVTEGQQNEAMVLLTVANHTLADVTVTGMRKEDAEALAVKRNVMPVTILSAKQIENRAANLTELLARQTGVQIRQTGGVGSEARISIRGLEGNRVQIFIDGNPLNTPDGSLGINDLPLQIIERIEIYKGAIPAWLGGDGLGSAVNVVIRHRDVSYIDATASYQSYKTVQTGLILKKTFDKSGIEAGGGIFTNSSDNNYVMESPYQPGLKIKRDHDRFKSLLAGGSIRFHRLWFDEVEIEGAYLNSQKQLQGIQQNIQHIQSQGTTAVAVLGLKKANLLNNKLSLSYHGIMAAINVKFVDTSSYSYDWNNHASPSFYGKGELGNGPNFTLTKQNEFRQQVNFNYVANNTFTLNLNNTSRIGHLDQKDDTADAYAGKNIYNYPGKLSNTITGFTVETHVMDDKLLFSTALKHYYNKVDGYNTNIYLQAPPDKVNNTISRFGYNAGVRYNFTNSLLVKASYEKALRLPSNAELFGDGVLITPSILLKPEIAYNKNVGLAYDKTNAKGKRLQVDANAFYMNVNNLIQLAGNGLTIGYVNFAKAKIYGADFDIKYDVTRNLYASFNITYQKLKDDNKYLPGTQNVDNPTYKLDIPNTPQFFTNWSVEYSWYDLLGKESKTKLLYEGSHCARYNYGFNVSAYDDYFIPSFLVHTISLEQSFKNKRYIIAAEANNFTDERVVNNYNQPLPGRTFRIKLRYLFLGKKLLQQETNP
ncbi:MAG TPA: TonB-dependent receptor [Puia sp.]|uniref:TonB-dependent receptor n=1 Tax=Puia sp. TaxID=2045100 RepID=UPI002C1F250B|nr:TonB-dependent receptor [Puia sp.]HVU98707.1 TonB-dependent receptor [Puia sp.]